MQVGDKAKKYFKRQVYRLNRSEREFQNLKRTKESLEKISPSFCLVRWKHATINLATGASKSCCHHPFKSIDLHSSFAQLHDNKEEQLLRKQMLNGLKPKDCSYCWWVEENGHSSDRQNWSAKSWMSPYFPNSSSEMTTEALSPSWVELNFSSVCNLKCVYCSPIFSTSWYKEIKDHGAYPTTVPHNSIEHLNHLEFQAEYENTALLEKFWPWFHDVLPGLKLLKITGGEPLLSSQTLRLMDLILVKKPQHLTLGINSNCSVPQKTWIYFIQKIQEIESSKSLERIYLHPSIDCSGERAEYIRSGLDFKLFTTNLELFLNETGSNVHFICTLNNLALGSLLDLWKLILEFKKKYHKPGREIAIGTEILQSPSWLSVNILPKEMLCFFEEAIAFAEANRDESGRGFYSTEIEGLKKARSAFLSESGDLTTLRKDFKTYVESLDMRRDSSFIKTFPELKSFYQTCAELI